MRTLRRVAVLGAGTMGSRIAAHFSNAGIPALLLDIVVPNQPNRNAASQNGLEAAAKGRPPAFFTDATASSIKTGNFEDDLARIANCDWVIEAITENLELKRSLWTKVIANASPDAILSTNTSGIPLHRIAEGWPDSVLRRFLGTHFFNPPRYLHLLEVIPGPKTDAVVLAEVVAFGDRLLGKGIVLCNDTPNFIANRIGSFFGSTVYKIMQQDGYTIEEVDAMTGSLIGLPNSATFRLLDLVGLDIWLFVGRNLYDAVPGDPWRERFLPPDFMKQMMAKGWIGDKAGQGFYRKVGPKKDIEALNWQTLEYAPAARPKFPSAEVARNIDDLPERLRTLLKSTDRVGTFLWKLFSDSFLYCTERLPEISGRIVEIDRAMRWGYAHKLGPFQLWDALGFEAVCERLEKDGRVLPPSIVAMRKSGAKSFYRAADANGQPGNEYFDLGGKAYRPLDAIPGTLSLAETKRARGVVKSNAGASLIDIGDGVVCLEFHSKMNSLGADTVAMIHAGIAETSKNFEALIIANEGENFSVGANLMLVLMAAQEQEWDDLNGAIHHFQQAMIALKYAPKPVIAAPFARALGGGCEIVLHSAAAQASAELYMGLVEVGVGLIPGAGGCKELIARLRDPRKVFELIGMAKVSGSAADAKKLGLLDKSAGISMNAARLIQDAKELALETAKSYVAGTPRTDIKVVGESGIAMIKVGAWQMLQAGYISAHDMYIAEKLAHVICGGRLSSESAVSEQYLLDLEREAFLSLCGHPKTQERMGAMLKTGKPLRN